MNYNERQNLKDRIEADLQLLMRECWDGDVISELHDAYEKLRDVRLEGYDD